MPQSHRALRCGKADEHGAICVGESGHRGRHTFRAMTARDASPRRDPLTGRTLPEEVDILDEAQAIVDAEDAMRTITAESAIGLPADMTPDEAYVQGVADAESIKSAAAKVAKTITMDSKSPAWSPGHDAFINLKGKAYLPARRRVQWMRGVPEAHPAWTIDTVIVEHQRGKRVSQTKVDGGYALVRANIVDESGRLIATGLKSEYSENFPDYLEKAETGAIARALAVAGYGTESALDFDEGADGGRIADSPVDRPNIGAANVSSAVGKGGRTAAPSSAQVNAVAKLSRQLGLSGDELVTIVEQSTGIEPPVLPADDDERSALLRAFFETMTSDNVGAVITALNALAASLDDGSSPHAI